MAKLPSATLLPDGVFLEHDRHHGVAAHALDGERARDLVLVAAEVLDARRTNFAIGNFAVSNHFGRLTSVSDSSLARSMLPSSISNSAFDFGKLLGKEHDVGLPAAKAALDIDAHLPGHEADLAFLDEHALGGGLRRRQAASCPATE